MRVCEWCSAAINPERKAAAKTCSDKCRDERRAQYARDYANARYVPKLQPQQTCEHCGGDYMPSRPGGKFCSRRCCWAAKTISERPRVRPCGKCGADTPTRPGKPVCSDCRADPRTRAPDHEWRRRLRAYGITQEEYDALWATQGRRCAICRRDTPTAKGWVIDHCHSTLMVRGVLCQPCNLALGQFRDDPEIMRAAAAYVVDARQQIAS